MSQQQALRDKTTGVRFMRAVKDFARSEFGWRAMFMFGALVALLLGINGASVLNSYVGRDFMTAIAERNNGEFVRQAMLYLGVFALSTIVAVVSRFTEERLGLLWREFLTRRVIGVYLDQGTYYRLEATQELANPDQRISEDVRAFTTTTLSFVLLLLNSSFTLLAFSGVLWSISPLLFGVAVVYAAFGSFVTIILGRPLIKLNHDQLDKEADFRSQLVYVRENAESILVAHREDRMKARLLDRLNAFVSNFRAITSVNRNVGFFTTGYNWVIQIIPALIIAPAYIEGKIEFGVITQSAMAFSTIVAAFSLIISQVQSISTFAAVVARLNSMVDAVERKQSPSSTGIDVTEADDQLTYAGLTLLSPDSQPVLEDLSIAIPSGSRVLISGDQTAQSALFRATAGLSTSGNGRITRPSAGRLYFLAERPYLPPGALRQVLVRDAIAPSISDEQINAVLQDLDLVAVVLRVGGLDAERDWGTFLSLPEQQLFVAANILLSAPCFAVLHRLDTALSADQVEKILKLFSKSSISYVNIGEPSASQDLYDSILEIDHGGKWSWRRVGAASAQ